MLCGELGDVTNDDDADMILLLDAWLPPSLPVGEKAASASAWSARRCCSTGGALRGDDTDDDADTDAEAEGGDTGADETDAADEP